MSRIAAGTTASTSWSEHWSDDTREGPEWNERLRWDELLEWDGQSTYD
jgi:hypothetical protein